MRIGMQGKIVVLYSLLILFAMQLSGVYLVKSLENYYLRNYIDNQVSRGELLGSFLRRYLLEEEQQKGELINNLIAEFGRDNPPTETMVLDRNGHLLAGPEQNTFSISGGRIIQDDILLALAGNRVETIRMDLTTGIRYYLLALPIKDSSSVVGVIFLKGTVEHIYHTLREIKFILISGWAVVLGIAIVIGFLLTKTITTPIREVTSRAAEMAQGNFDHLIQIRSEDEIGELGRMFNFLTNRLQTTLKEIYTEKNKVEAILNYMTDGVVAFNKEEKIIHLNPAAQEILQWTGSPMEQGVAAGTIFGDLFQPGELEKILQSRSSYTKEVTPKKPQERTFQLHFAPFQEDEEQQGMLLVIHDVTKERIYTRMQQEFVANVSHELRTPLTILKNYLETLLSGAQEYPEIREKFLNVLEKETERMVKLVEDLLELSRMDSQKNNWFKAEYEIETFVLDVIGRVDMEIKAKKLKLDLILPQKKLIAYFNKDKMCQVMLNLLDNAIKFSPEGGEIKVQVFEEDGYACFAVEDGGPGIPENEIERVFERFYRVDKTRSRESGGTGLGLSIAKQIVEAHEGRIFLKSEPGLGTIVTFCLPKYEKESENQDARKV
ncbi:MAG: ATP-binding protein [Dethiobacteria bacterium]|jgi:two-component system sensor histidine kinase VicK